MHSINRAAILVRPKEPFFQWARRLEGGLPKIVQPWCSVYLVEEPEAEPTKLLRKHFAAIFEEQLESWHTVQIDWPGMRTFAKFEQWFDVEIVDVVFDLPDKPPEHED